MAVKLSWASQDIDKIYIIADPVFAHFIKKNILMLVDKLAMPGLITKMLHEAVRLFKLPNKLPEDILKLQHLENTLAHLTEGDFVNYFSKFVKGDELNERRQWITQILQQNYPFLLQRLSEKVLLAITDPCSERLHFFQSQTYPPLTLTILTNPVLLNQLSQKGLVTLLKRLPLRNISPAFSDANLASRLTFPTLRDWLDYSEDVSYVTHEESFHLSFDRAMQILTDASLLQKLSSDQIVFIANYIHFDMVGVFKNTIFRSRILQDQHPNRFLIALCRVKSNNFAIEISNYQEMVALLSVDELMIIAALDCRVSLRFIQNDSILKMVTNEQLWTLVRAADLEGVPYVVEKNLFPRLSDGRLKEFAERWKSSLMITQDERDKIYRENVRRNNPALERKLVEFETKQKAKRSTQTDVGQMQQSTPPVAKEAPPIAKKSRPKLSHDASKNKVAKSRFSRPAAASLGADPGHKKRDRATLTVQILRTNEAVPSPLARAADEMKAFAKKKQERNQLILQIIIFTLLTIAGIALIASGIGCAVGIPLFANLGILLFGWTSVSPAIFPILIGIGVAGISIIQDVRKAIQYQTLQKTDSLSQTSQASSEPPLKLLPSFSSEATKLLDQEKIPKTEKEKNPEYPSKKSALRSHCLLQDHSGATHCKADREKLAELNTSDLAEFVM